MKPVPHGEPYAGKLHVRFDEGAGVPDNKGRSALLYTLQYKLNCICLIPWGLCRVPRGEILEQKTDAYIGGIWYTIARNTMTYNPQGKRIKSENLAGQVTTTAWDQFACTSVDELISAAKNAKSAKHAYAFDDIGNRETASERGTNSVYAANQLNQYTEISSSALSASPRETFTPQFDDDGNQTLIKTSTGIWQVQYNGENRPVGWTCGTTNIVMKFDRMGRRVEYLETTGGPQSPAAVTNVHHRFVYDGYLCVQRLDAAANNSIDLAFGWDPTEPVATRPLWMQRVSGTYNFFYFHDGNKNVSDVVSYQAARGVPAHYEYAPFGAVTAVVTNNAITAFSVAEANPFRFSSEYADDALGLVYYNYRHYDSVVGRWTSRDPVQKSVYACNDYDFCLNLCCLLDVLGKMPVVRPIGASPDSSGVIWFGVAFESTVKGETIKVVKNLKFDLYDCITKERLFHDGKTWSEESSVSTPNTNVRWGMIGASLPMSSLANIGMPGKDKCRRGTVQFTSDFFTNNVPKIDLPIERFLPTGENPKSWFSYHGDDSDGAHSGTVLSYKGSLPYGYSNSDAFATLRMVGEYTCGKADPKLTVWTTGSWNISPVQRLNQGLQPRGHKRDTDADEWFMNGKKIDLATMEPTED